MNDFTQDENLQHHLVEGTVPMLGKLHNQPSARRSIETQEDFASTAGCAAVYPYDVHPISKTLSSHRKADNDLSSVNMSVVSAGGANATLSKDKGGNHYRNFTAAGPDCPPNAGSSMHVREYSTYVRSQSEESVGETPTPAQLQSKHSLPPPHAAEAEHPTTVDKEMEVQALG